MTETALQTAIAKAGGPVALGKVLGISSQAIAQWRRAPASRVLQIEEVSGISRHDLRPDVFGPAPTPIAESA